MESSLKETEVEDFLKSNPEYLESWLRKHGTTEILSKIKDIEPVNKPKAKFNAAARNSITASMFKNYVDGLVQVRREVAMNRKKLLAMSETEVFMELIRDIASELDVNVLCHKILRNVSILTSSDRGSLFLVRGSKDNRYLVSKLFDVTETSTLEESLHTDETEIKVPFGKGIAGAVAQTKETINIKDAYEDPRFNKDIDKKTGYRTHSILCMPILNYEEEVIGVAQIINKVTGSHQFEDSDIDVFKKYLLFCGIGITNAQLFQLSVQEYKRNRLLLNLARGVFGEQQNLENLVQKIMLDAQDILQCARCSVYLMDEVLDQSGQPDTTDNQLKSTKHVIFDKAFELYPKDGGNIHIPSTSQVNSSKIVEIAKHVVVNEQPLNIADLEQDGRFGKGPFIDEDGFTTQSVLSMPIYNSERKIVGVTQLINKLNGVSFNESDCNIMEAFSIFTGLGLHNCQMYEKACRLMAKQKVALEVLSYHATSQQEETDRLVKSEIPCAKELKLYTYEFNDLVLTDDQTLQSVIAMFRDTALIEKFKIPFDVMCRWTCSVKKNYRPVTYHNWRHAFNVTQTMFTMLYTGELIPIFSHLDVFAMLVACLCHDLDHRGTNNAFQVKVLSPLALLYGTSVMEHHHFDHCIMILNSEGNNIFQSLSSEEYRHVIKMLEFCILSTDLALYFRKRGDFKKLVDSGCRDFKTDTEKNLLKAMMMTACDVAAITKPWEVQFQVAQLVANEFFEQGDVEKTELGETPMAMMDRDKKDELPKMQVGFIDAICIPVYEMFATVNENLSPLLQGVLNNRKNWNNLENLDKEDESKLATDNSTTKDTEKVKTKNKKHAGKEKKAAKGIIKKNAVQDSSQQSPKKKVKLVRPGSTKICTVL